ncbi:MAG: hypothetical protein AAF288_06280 [Planctomycetota bacterium]
MGPIGRGGAAASGEALAAQLPPGVEPVRRGRWGFVAWRTAEPVGADLAGGCDGAARPSHASWSVLARAATLEYDVVEGWCRLPVTRRVDVNGNWGGWLWNAGALAWGASEWPAPDRAATFGPPAGAGFLAAPCPGFARLPEGSPFATVEDQRALLWPAQTRWIGATRGRRSPARLWLADASPGPGARFQTPVSIHGRAARVGSVAGSPVAWPTALVECARVAIAPPPRVRCQRLGTVLVGRGPAEAVASPVQAVEPEAVEVPATVGVASAGTALLQSA